MNSLNKLYLLLSELRGLAEILLAVNKKLKIKKNVKTKLERIKQRLINLLLIKKFSIKVN
jgi:hypothetical protein